MQEAEGKIVQDLTGTVPCKVALSWISQVAGA